MFCTCSNFGKGEPCPSWGVLGADHEALKEALIAETNCPGGVRLVGQLLVTLVHSDILLQ